MKETIGERIIALRKANGLTQVQLAERLNISDKAISKWESGKGDPSLVLLQSLSEVFGCTIDYIVKGDAKQEEKIGHKKITVEKNNREHLNAMFEEVLKIMKERVSAIVYDLWIETLVPLRIDENVLVLSCRTRSGKNQILKNHMETLFDAVNEVNEQINDIHITVGEEYDKQLLMEALKVAVDNNGVNTSLLKRNLKIGYYTAAALIDGLEKEGYISKYNGHNLRDVYINDAKYKKIIDEVD